MASPKHRAESAEAMTREEYMAEVERLGRPVSWPPRHHHSPNLRGKTPGHSTMALEDGEARPGFRPAETALDEVEK